MVIPPKTQPRKSSQGGSLGQSSHKSRRRPSLRKTSTTPMKPNPKKAKSFSVAVPATSPEERRPSAPANLEPPLSIADRFMSSSYTKSPSIATSIVSDSSARLSVADRFMHSSPSGSVLHERSTSFSSGKLLVSPRLTIADAFMKSSLSPTRSRADSFADDLGSRSIASRKPSQVHPLDSTTFSEDDRPSSFLNLDLSLTSPSIKFGQQRPWGSQDTLVQEKKRPIYANYIDSEKNTTIDVSEEDDHKRGDDYDEEEEVGYSKYYTHHWDDEDEEEEEPVPEEEEIEEEPEEIKKVEEEVIKPVPAPRPKKIKPKKKPTEDEDVQSQGFWVGCCFVSCGTRPSRKAIEEKKKKREKELEKEEEPRARKCGFSRRGWVFCTFLSLILFVLMAYFLWPRTPLMRIEGASLTSPAKITETKQGVMVGNVAFESEWLVNITVDNRQNHVPTRLVQVQVIAKDALTGLIIGKGLHNDDPNPEHIILGPNQISTIQIPIRVDYQARDSTDTTFLDLTRACAPHYLMSNAPYGQQMREALPLHFWITLHFLGLDWLGYKPTVIATPATGGFACPQP